MGACAAALRSRPRSTATADTLTMMKESQAKDSVDRNGLPHVHSLLMYEHSIISQQVSLGEFCIAGGPLLIPQDSQIRDSDTIQHGDTGRTIWEGSLALAQLLDCNPHLVRNRTILELGAGRGIAGMSAALLGASHVVLTDLPYTLNTLEEGLAMNGLSSKPTPAAPVEPSSTKGKAEVAELDWGRPEDFVSRRVGQHFDVLIAADCIWHGDLIPPLVGAILAICKESPTCQVLVVYTARLLQNETAFLEGMERASFTMVWCLPGGDPAIWCIGHPGTGSPNPDNVQWHPNYTPNSRMRLWCFQLDIGKICAI